MNIALFWPNWIGDAVMATPAARALRQHFAQAHIVGVLRPYVTGVVEGSPWMDQQIYLDARGPREFRWRAVARELRQRRIDLAVLLPNSFHAAWVAWLGRCRRRVGLARHGRSALLTDALPAKRGSWGRLLPSPIIDDYNRLAQRVGCPPPGHRMLLFSSATDESAADALWERAGLKRRREVICFNPGAAFGAAKHWPSDYFAALARAFVDRRGSGVLVLCGPGDRNLAEEIAVKAGREHVHSLSHGPLSLGVTKACIRRAHLLVTTDSGPRHFAAAFDRPVVTLFGPTHIAWTESYHPKAIHLQERVDCGPCQRRVCPLDHRCMKLLTPDAVFRAANALLDRYAVRDVPSLQAAG